MVTLTPPTLLVNGAPADPAHVPLPIQVVHGRARVDAQPDAPSLTMEWVEPSTCPRLGDRIELRVTLPEGAIPLWDDPRVLYDDPNITYGGGWAAIPLTRFLGDVVDVDTQEVWQGTFGGPATSRITAVAWQADLGRCPVWLNRPAESDVARVAAIAAYVPFPITIVGGPGPMLAASWIERDALGALYEVAQSAGGLLWQDQDGRLCYGAEDFRATEPAVMTLPADSIVDELRWQTSTADMINKVTVTWGDPQQQHTLTDDASVFENGIHHVQVSTGLADQGAADRLGNLILARRAWPFWWTSDVIVDSALVPEVSTFRNVARLRTSDAVLLPIPPVPGVTGLLAEWIVEGWVETWPAHDRCVMQLAVSDRARWALTQLRLWSHADDFTWQQELNRGSWFDCLILQPEEAVAA